MVFRPLAYRLSPVLAEANPIETLYGVNIACKISAASHVRFVAFHHYPTTRHLAVHPWGTG